MMTQRTLRPKPKNTQSLSSVFRKMQEDPLQHQHFAGPILKRLWALIDKKDKDFPHRKW